MRNAKISATIVNNIALTAKFNRAVTELILTVDAMEVLIKYCTNSFPQVDQFI
jgi:hypothetical protein